MGIGDINVGGAVDTAGIVPTNGSIGISGIGFPPGVRGEHAMSGAGQALGMTRETILAGLQQPDVMADVVAARVAAKSNQILQIAAARDAGRGGPGGVSPGGR